MFRLIRFLPSRWWSPAAWKTWSSYVHWRLETYGVYYPNGQFNLASLQALLSQLPSYQQWLIEFDQQRGKPYKVS